jgi:hypothetical protein
MALSRSALTYDPSGDPLGNRIHAQAVEPFSYFLYAYPSFKKYFTPRFYRKARDFAITTGKQQGFPTSSKP